MNKKSMNKKYNLLSAVQICFEYAPAAMLAVVIINIISGVLPTVMVYIVAQFIDSSLSLTTTEPQIMPLIISVVLMFLGYLYTQLSQVFVKLSTKRIEILLKSKLRPLMVKKQAGLDYEMMENTENLDLIAFVCMDTESRFIGILNDFTTALRVGMQLIGMLTILINYSWWLIILFLVGTIPLVIISYRGGTALVEKDKEITVITRMMYYFSDVLSGRETAAERTLFSFSEGINEKFKALHLKRSNMNTILLARWESLAKACGVVLNLFVLASIIALIGNVSDGAMSSGNYIAVVGAMISLARTMTSALSRLTFNISMHMGYMRAYEKFWTLPTYNENLYYSPVKMNFERLEIKNLRFKYKSSDIYVLDGVNLIVEKGKTYSLIGQNGAGKSTLIKILSGLYRDFEGEIIINNKDIRNYSVNELRGIFGIVYQDYAKYYISLKDNIIFNGNDDGFDELTRITDLDGVIEKLPMGENTPLGKIFDEGADISGGEWQKIAIARALKKDCPFIILDEPTASLSPMMESKIYNTFAEISAGRTQLLISHRLGSTKISETLLVLHNGRIVESGRHNELMAAGGLYSEMFESQRSWYSELR